jgi:UDP-glucose 4-epimerase
MVTGAAGFIGSALTKRLSQDGCSVVGLDNERSGDWSRVRDHCQAVSSDISALTVEELRGLLEGVDVCFHLAAEKYNSSRSTPQRVIEVNITATQRLLEAAALADVRKVVFTSSLYAYGSLGPEPMRITDLPYPTTAYGMSKVAGEHLLRIAERDHGLAWAAARLFFVYGPDQYAEGGYKSVIISNFERMLRGDPPTIYGDGNQRLDYVYIDDIVAGLLQLSLAEHDRALVNLGSGSAPSILHLTRRMLAVAESDGPPVFCPPDWTAGSVRVADITETRATLGWEGGVGLDKGLERVWNWMRSRNG